MTIPKKLDDAASRLTAASWRIDEVRRKKSASLQSHEEWLNALTEFAQALADLHSANNESIHEKLHELAGRAGLGRFRPAAKP